MKPITNSRHGLPLIIFPGKVTQSGTLWNPGNCIVCSEHWAGSCRALPGLGDLLCHSLQQGKERNPLPRLPCHQHCSWIWLLAAPPPFRCGQAALQSRQKIRWMCQAIWVSEGSVWMFLFGNFCFHFFFKLFIFFIRKDREGEFWSEKSKPMAQLWDTERDVVGNISWRRAQWESCPVSKLTIGGGGNPGIFENYLDKIWPDQTKEMAQPRNVLHCFLWAKHSWENNQWYSWRVHEVTDSPLCEFFTGPALFYLHDYQSIPEKPPSLALTSPQSSSGKGKENLSSCLSHIFIQ